LFTNSNHIIDHQGVHELCGDHLALNVRIVQ